MKNIKLNFIAYVVSALMPFAMAGTANAGLNDGLAGYWTFDEGVGIVANDVSGNGNDGAINGASYVAGKVGTNALNFDGSSAYVDAPDSASLDITGDFSIGAWVKPNAASLSGLVGIASKDGSSSRAYALILNNGKVEGYFSSDGTAYTGDLVGATTLAAGVWSHIAVTRTGATLKVFVNGVLDATGAVPTTAIHNSSDSLVVGARLAGVGLFTGDADDVKVYDRALADCEVGRLAGGTGQCLVPAVQSPASPSQEYLQLDAELTQDIVVDDQQSPGNGTIGMAWLPNGNMIRKAGNQIIEYSTDQTRNVFATPVYDIVATHTVSGLDSSGQGITNGLDGYVYSNSPNGLWRIDVDTWTADKVGTHGYWYGIGTLPDGRIVNQANTQIYIYDPVTSTQSLLYNPGLFVDDLTTTSGGLIALAMRYNNSVRIIDASGTLVNTAFVHTSGGAQPDGMAFGGGSLYTANTDGTISRFDFDAPGIAGGASHEVIVAAQGGYGDLASVGPDGAFYISINGIRYDNGTWSPNWGIVRISIPGGFDTPPGVPANKPPVADAGAAQTVECSGSSSASVTLDGSASSDPDSDPLTYSWSWAGGSATGVSPSASFPLGTTTVTLTVDDGEGHTDTATTSVTVVDTTPPAVSAGPDVTLEATSVAGANFNVVAQASASDTCCVVSTGISPVGPYPLGDTTVTVSATDCSGNTASDTMVITVQDTTPPVLTPPADVTVEATGVSTPVTIGSATATDIFPVAIVNDAPGSFPVGTTVVTWTATDANGNTSTATQNITVEDTTPPVVTAQLIPVSGGHDEDDDKHESKHGDEHGGKGLFQVVFSATDIADPNPVLVATLNGVAVTNGQIVKLERSRKSKLENEHGKLEIKGMSFTLDVTATDASGNVGTASDAYAFPVHKGDDHGIHRGNDKEDKHADSGKHKSEDKSKVEHKDRKSKKHSKRDKKRS